MYIMNIYNFPLSFLLFYGFNILLQIISILTFLVGPDQHRFKALYFKGETNKQRRK